MILSKETLSLLKAFSSINSNILIKPGNKLATVSAAKDIMAEVEVAENFTKTAGIFNLNELLGVVSLFTSPEIEMDDKFLIVKEGKNKIKYVYADASLLTVPSKSITMPPSEINFTLTAGNLQKIQKASSALSVGDLAFIGDGSKIVAQVLDTKNPTSNNFELDLDTPTTEKFRVLFKVDKLKLVSDLDYSVAISSKKISKFSATSPKLSVFVAVESQSEFS
jgi:hypothetical protein